MNPSKLRTCRAEKSSNIADEERKKHFSGLMHHMMRTTSEAEFFITLFYYTLHLNQSLHMLFTYLKEAKTVNVSQLY